MRFEPGRTMHDCGWPRVKELTSRLVQVERGGEQGCFSIGSQGLGLACTEQGSEAGGGCKQDALPTNSRSQGRLGRDHEHWGVGSTKVRRVCVGRGPTGVGLCVCSWNLLTDQFQATRTALGVSDVAVGGPPAALLAEPDSRSALMANMPIQKGRDEARPCLGPLAMNAPMSVTNVNAMMNLEVRPDPGVLPTKKPFALHFSAMPTVPWYRWPHTRSTGSR